MANWWDQDEVEESPLTPAQPEPMPADDGKWMEKDKIEDFPVVAPGDLKAIVKNVFQDNRIPLPDGTYKEPDVLDKLNAGRAMVKLRESQADMGAITEEVITSGGGPALGAEWTAAMSVIASIAASRIKDGTATPGDYAVVAHVLDKQRKEAEEADAKPDLKREYENLRDLILSTVRFGSGLTSTGPVKEAVRGAVMRGATKGVVPAVRMADAVVLQPQVEASMARQLAGQAVGEAARLGTPAMLAGAANYAGQRMAPQTPVLGEDAEWEVVEGDPFWKAATMALGQQYIEQITEVSGGGMKQIGGKLVKASPALSALKKKMAQSWISKGKNRSVAEFLKVYRDAIHFNGLFEEFGEERLADLLTGVTGKVVPGFGDFGATGQVLSSDEDERAKGLRQFRTELIGFGLMGAATSIPAVANANTFRRALGAALDAGYNKRRAAALKQAEAAGLHGGEALIATAAVASKRFQSVDEFLKHRSDADAEFKAYVAMHRRAVEAMLAAGHSKEDAALFAAAVLQSADPEAAIRDLQEQEREGKKDGQQPASGGDIGTESGTAAPTPEDDTTPAPTTPALPGPGGTGLPGLPAPTGTPPSGGLPGLPAPVEPTPRPGLPAPTTPPPAVTPPEGESTAIPPELTARGPLADRMAVAKARREKREAAAAAEPQPETFLDLESVREFDLPLGVHPDDAITVRDVSGHTEEMTAGKALDEIRSLEQLKRQKDTPQETLDTIPERVENIREAMWALKQKPATEAPAPVAPAPEGWPKPISDKQRDTLEYARTAGFKVERDEYGEYAVTTPGGSRRTAANGNGVWTAIDQWREQQAVPEPERTDEEIEAELKEREAAAGEAEEPEAPAPAPAAPAAEPPTGELVELVDLPSAEVEKVWAERLGKPYRPNWGPAKTTMIDELKAAGKGGPVTRPAAGAPHAQQVPGPKPIHEDVKAPEGPGMAPGTREGTGPAEGGTGVPVSGQAPGAVPSPTVEVTPAATKPVNPRGQYGLPGLEAEAGTKEREEADELAWSRSPERKELMDLAKAGVERPRRGAERGTVRDPPSDEEAETFVAKARRVIQAIPKAVRDTAIRAVEEDAEGIAIDYDSIKEALPDTDIIPKGVNIDTEDWAQHVLRKIDASLDEAAKGMDKVGDFKIGQQVIDEYDEKGGEITGWFFKDTELHAKTSNAAEGDREIPYHRLRDATERPWVHDVRAAAKRKGQHESDEAQARKNGRKEAADRLSRLAGAEAHNMRVAIREGLDEADVTEGKDGLEEAIYQRLTKDAALSPSQVLDEEIKTFHDEADKVVLAKLHQRLSHANRIGAGVAGLEVEAKAWEAGDRDGPPLKDTLEAVEIAIKQREAEIKLERKAREEPAKEETPAEKAGWQEQDIRDILAELDKGNKVLLGGNPFGIPTIQEQPNVQFHGFGMFTASTPEWEIDYDGGVAMQRTTNGRGYTIVHEKRGTFPYDFDDVRAKLEKWLPKPAKAAAPLSAKERDFLEQLGIRAADKMEEIRGKARDAGVADITGGAANKLIRPYVPYGPMWSLPSATYGNYAGLEPGAAPAEEAEPDEIMPEVIRKKLADAGYGYLPGLPRGRWVEAKPGGIAGKEVPTLTVSRATGIPSGELAALADKLDDRAFPDRGPKEESKPTGLPPAMDAWVRSLKNERQRKYAIQYALWKLGGEKGTPPPRPRAFSDKMANEVHDGVEALLPYTPGAPTEEGEPDLDALAKEIDRRYLEDLEKSHDVVDAVRSVTPDQEAALRTVAETLRAEYGDDIVSDNVVRTMGDSTSFGGNGLRVVDGLLGMLLQSDMFVVADPRVIDIKHRPPAAGKRDYGTPAKPNRVNLGRHFQEQFEAGRRYKDIVEVRAEVGKLVGGEIRPGTAAAKDVDEAVEIGVVLTGSKIANDASKTVGGRWDALLDLYQRQPRLAVKTSTSVKEQAYSTPVPIAFLCAQLAGVTPDSTVYDSSAGNGILLMTGKPIANELNPDRAAALIAMGIKQTNIGDATSHRPDETVDAVIINPPFGKVPDHRGKPISWKIGGVKTTEVDHVIIMNSLPAMRDGGRAVLILGSKGKENRQTALERAQSYSHEHHKPFYDWLYQNYNVVDHFTVNGDLYAKQGAKFPIDIIVIHGRGASARPRPWDVQHGGLPTQLDTWEELKHDKLEAILGTEELPVPSGGVGPVGTTDVGQLPGAAVGEGGPNVPGVETQVGTPGVAEPVGGIRGEPTGPNGTGTGPVGVGLPVENGEQGGAPQPVPGETGGRDGGVGGNVPGVSGGRSSLSSEPAEQPGSGLNHEDLTEDQIAEYLEWRAGIGPKPAWLEARKPTAPAAKTPPAAQLGVSATLGASVLGEPAKTEEPPSTSKTPKGKGKGKGGGKGGAHRSKKSLAEKKAAADAAFEQSIKDYADLAKTLLGGTPIINPKLFAASIRLVSNGVKKEYYDFVSFVQHLANRMGNELVLKCGPALEEAWATVRAEMDPRHLMGPHRPVNTIIGGKKALVETPKENEFQVPYEPQSAVGKHLGTLVPRNHSTAIKEALEEVEGERGPVADWVAGELDMTMKELEEAFAAEQIDALALAIQAHKQGFGMIVGDQTGIGKGRVLAGMVRYAMKQGLIPVFITEKPDLFQDMMRDLNAIGMGTEEGEDFLPLPTNHGTGVTAPDGSPLSYSEPVIKRMLREAIANLEAGIGLQSTYRRAVVQFNGIFTTYSQLQTVKGEETWRHPIFRSLMRRAMFILDESHNAGGQERPLDEEEEDEERGPTRAEFVRELISDAPGVVYSSATYAKNPGVMGLYGRTEMALAVNDPADLPAIIRAGGVPLQQVTSEMLVEAGQFLRRERTFDGVSMDPEVVDVGLENADRVSTDFRNINHFSNAFMSIVMPHLEMDVVSGGGVMLDDESMSISGTSFTNVLWNLVDQMLLSMKAKAAAQRAIKACREVNPETGETEQAIIVVDNTLGAALDHYLELHPTADGGEVNFSFKHMLLNYLDRSRTIIFKRDRNDKKSWVRIYVTDDMIREAVAASDTLGDEDPAEVAERIIQLYTDVKREIMESSVDLPASPIDAMRQELEAAGLTVGEITGRENTLQYKDGKAYLRTRPAAELGPKGKKATIGQFQNGDLDVVIMNRSASTGISMHASEKNPPTGQRRRRMIVAQAAKNIDEFMQVLGRIHRTGQVIKPAYTLLMSNVPSELRVASVLVQKLSSLNANVTAASAGGIGFDVPDVLNEVGNEAVADYLEDNEEVMEALHIHDTRSRAEDSDGKAFPWLACCATGRMAIEPIKIQTEFWEEVTRIFTERIEELNRSGENPLIARTLPLEAETKEQFEIFASRGGDSPFAQPAFLERIKAKKLGKPFAGTVVRKKALAFYGLDESATDDAAASAQSDWATGLIDTLKTQTVEYWESIKDKIAEDARDEYRSRMEEKALHIQDAILGLSPGTPVVVHAWFGDVFGVVIGLTRKGKSKNPTALSNWVVEVAVADATKVTRVNLAQQNRSYSLVARSFEHSFMDRWRVTQLRALKDFDDAASISTEERWMATGNLLAAYGQLVEQHGKVTFFTDADGRVRRGVLLPRSFNPAAYAANQPVLIRTAEQALTYMRRTHTRLEAPDVNAMFVMVFNGTLSIRTSTSRQRSGKYFMNPALLEAAGKDFTSISGAMLLQVDDESRFIPVLKALMDLTPLQATQNKPVAREIVGESDEGVEAYRARRSAEARTAPRQPATEAAHKPAPTPWFDKTAEGPATPWGSGELGVPLKFQPTPVTELVSLIKELLGEAPILKKRMRAYLGAFAHTRSGEAHIFISAAAAKDETLLAKVMAHEFGHFLDWLADNPAVAKRLDRGNILGSIATLVNYRKHILPGYPGGPGPLTKADRDDLKEEARKMMEPGGSAWVDSEAAAILGVEPQDILDIFDYTVAAPNVPEVVLSFIATLTDDEKKLIVRRALRGKVSSNLQRKLSSLSKRAAKREIAELHGELITAEIEKRRLLSMEDITEELKNLSQWWTPFDRTQDAEYTKYRDSSRELYADAMSVLFNAPHEVAARAPKFWDGFVAYAEAKKEAFDQIIYIQGLLQGESAELSRKRVANVNAMFGSGHNKMLTVNALRLSVRTNTISKIHDLFAQALISKYSPMTARIRAVNAKAQRAGQDIPPEALALYYATQEMAHADAPIAAFLQRVHDAIQPLYDAGVTDDQLGRLLFYERVAFDADRRVLAQPLGYTPSTAEHERDALIAELRPERWAKVKAGMEKWREVIWEIVERAGESGVYGDEMVDQFRKNKDVYSAFQVVKYFEGTVSPAVHKQVGTFADIMNPFHATTMKMVALIRWTELNNAKSMLRDFMSKFFGTEIRSVKLPYRKHEPSTRPSAGFDYLHMMENGKHVVYELPEEMVASFQSHDVGMLRRVAQLIGTPTYALWHKLYVAYNPGFLAANLFKDIARTWVDLGTIGHSLNRELREALIRRGMPPEQAKEQARKQKITIGQLAWALLKANPAAVRKAMGITDPDVEEMLDAKAFSTPFVQVSLEDITTGGNTERLLQQYGVKPADRNFAPPTGTPWEQTKQWMARGMGHFGDAVRAIPVLGHTLRFLEAAGTWEESLTKIAAWNLLKERGVDVQKRACIVRRHVGTPDFKQKGLATILSNNIFMYWNVRLQGLSADWELATGRSPIIHKTAAGYWWRRMIQVVLPTTLTKAAVYGAFGKAIQMMLAAGWVDPDDDKLNSIEKVIEAIQDGYFRQSQYVLDNYLNIPIGVLDTASGLKGMFITIPYDDIGALLARMTSAAMDCGLELGGVRTRRGGVGRSFGQTVTYPVQEVLPNWSPPLLMAGTWWDYMQDENPVNRFTGSVIVPQTEWEARLRDPWPARQAMMAWTTKQMGIGGDITLAMMGGWTGTPMQAGEETWQEAVASVPGISRLFRITDRGMDEARWMDVAMERADAAVERLKLAPEVRAMTRQWSRYNTLRSNSQLVGEEPQKRLVVNAWMSRMYSPARDAIEYFNEQGDEASAEATRQALAASAKAIRDGSLDAVPDELLGGMLWKLTDATIMPKQEFDPDAEPEKRQWNLDYAADTEESKLLARQGKTFDEWRLILTSESARRAKKDVGHLSADRMRHFRLWFERMTE